MGAERVSVVARVAGCADIRESSGSTRTGDAFTGTRSATCDRGMARCRESMDWMGGARYLSGTGGGGLGGGESGRFVPRVAAVATVLQLNRLSGSVESARAMTLPTGVGGSTIRLEGAIDGAYVVQLKWLCCDGSRL
jgi:hypothetical protein